MMRYLTSGESHGKAVMAIIEGIPANLRIDVDFINDELKRRQMGYGRGVRMSIESDKVEILSGVRGGKTTGSPISLLIKNKDWENWKDSMAIDKNHSTEPVLFTKPRPGHGDLAGAIKYNQRDIRNILERASARETAIRVAIGAIAKQLLKLFYVEVYSHVIEIGGISISQSDYKVDQIKKADYSTVRVIEAEAEEKIIIGINEAKKAGDTLGGVFEVVAVNLPVGLGSHVHWDRKLDGKIAQGLMSIQGIKGVEIGLGFRAASLLGSEVHDEIYYDENYYRQTNHAGGIEAGISNGNHINVKAAMKPIPSLAMPLKSVDMETKEAYKAQKERGDVCAVPSASIIAEAVLSWIIASELTIKFGGDSIEEMKKNYLNYKDYIKGR